MGARESITDPVVIWRPQAGPQLALCSCPVFEILYGGARGGGKTDGVLGRFIGRADRYGEHCIGILIRRTLVELSETLERARQLYVPLGATCTDNGKLFRFPNGARLRAAYLDHDSDADAYQGHSYTDVMIEEMGNFPSQAPVMKMMATARSAHGVPPQFVATANPGGPGHQWVKRRYVDPAPHGMRIITDPGTGLQRVYIPARVADNRMLMERDPQYVARIRMSGSPELVRAWLEGDWSIVAGAYFSEFSTARHVIEPFAIPAHWMRFRSFDWGSAAPFSVGWWAVSDGEMARFPRGALIRYREWYGAASPNVGLKLTTEQVADGIREHSRDESYSYSVADPAIYQQDGGPSIAERMAKCGVVFRAADNKRLPGWAQVRSRLVGDDERPMIYFFSSCSDTIRTLPALQHDPDRPEDVDTEAEDHAADEIRYACMSRPWARSQPEAAKPIDAPLTYADVIRRQERIERNRDERRI